MKFASVISLLVAVTATLTPSTVLALPTGAAGCGGGGPAPTPGHGGEATGSVEDGGYTLIAEATGTDNEYLVTLSGPEFKGFLFRTELGTSILDEGIGQEADACTGTAVGVTHVSPDPKTEATVLFLAPEGSTTATIDVSVVKSFSDYYYTGITIDLPEPVVETEPPVVATLVPTDGETEPPVGGGDVDPIVEQLDRIEAKLDLLLNSTACADEVPAFGGDEETMETEASKADGMSGCDPC